MSGDDAVLMESWLSTREPEAFKEITRRYSGMVYATCMRILGNTTDAEDLTQECFLTLAKASKMPHESLGGWLHTVAHRKCIDWLRSDLRRLISGEDLAPPAVPNT